MQRQLIPRPPVANQAPGEHEHLGDSLFMMSEVLEHGVCSLVRYTVLDDGHHQIFGDFCTQGGVFIYVVVV
jgi:hypothetical protein